MWGSPKTHAYTHQKVHLEMAFALSTGFGALPQVFLVRFIMSFLETMTLSKTFYWKNHIHIYHGIHIHKMFISYIVKRFSHHHVWKIYHGNTKDINSIYFSNLVKFYIKMRSFPIR